MNLPSKQEILEIFKKYHTPIHIIRHSRAVNKVANYLANVLDEVGVDVNKDLVDRASVLHDVLRVCDIKGDLFAFTVKEDETQENKDVWLKQQKKYQNTHHAQATFSAFKDKYPEMAEVIKKHRLSAVLKNDLKTWEEKIVYYADKRVDHDKFVSLDKRLEEGNKRWSIKNNDSQILLEAIKKLEQEIFTKINEDPKIINDL